MRFSDLLFGRPLATAEEGSERIGAGRGVAVLGLDALASASYGPEAMLTVLLPLGVSGLPYMAWITLAIVGVLVVLTISYGQTIEAYPSGGGAYAVAKENLGTNAGLLAAGALALDYLLNVAVAIAAGVGALVSALPVPLPHTLALCLGVLLLLTLVNLRGVRATSAALSVPTYAFVLCMGAVLAIGVWKVVTSDGAPTPVVPPETVPSTLTAASGWLLLRAFANGCTAMTGVEAVSTAVPIFREPAPLVARRALHAMIAILVTLLVGIAILCKGYRVTATHPGEPGYQSVLSQVVGAVAGRDLFYQITMLSVVGVLLLSANTSFAGFPRVCRLLSRDRFLPEPFEHRGRRLVFSYGIVVLAVLSGALLIVFGGITDHLIPLFAIGALLAFTMSQLGMVAHWRKQASRRALHGMLLNGVGATITGITALLVFIFKFDAGAWISALLLLGMLVTFKAVRRHYDFIERVVAAGESLELEPARPPIAVVPLRRWDAVSLKALNFALALSPRVYAVQILTGENDADDLGPRWAELAEEPARKRGFPAPELVVRYSAHRNLYAPLRDLVRALARDNPDHYVAVIVPQLVEARWYQYLLHQHSAWLIKTLLLLQGGPQVVVITTPWHVREWLPERWRLLRRQSPGSTRG